MGEEITRPTTELRIFVANAPNPSLRALGKRNTMIRAYLTLMILVLFTGCSTTRITDDIAISNPKFWVSMQQHGKTNWTQVATTEFPWKKHRIYGWSLDIETTRTNATWHALYQFPHPTDYARELPPSNHWGDVTSDFSRVITKPKPLSRRKSGMSAVCVVMPGEPSGPYAIIVFVDYIPVYTFRYHITESEEEKEAQH